MKPYFLIALISFTTMLVSANQQECSASHISSFLTHLHMNFFQQLFTTKDKRTLTEMVGPLKPNPDYKGWYESQPVHIPYLGQKVKITFTQGDDAFFMTAAEVVLKRFFQLQETTRWKDSKSVESYYQLCVQELKVDPLPIKTAHDVWNFVTPTGVLIERNSNGKYYVTVSCTCAWENQHGLQLVFREGKKLTRVSGHDGQLENWN